MYSSQELKAKKDKSKLEWLLVRNVVDHKSVMQNRIKTLQQHRQTLEQKWWRSLLARETAELVTEITQELQSWQAEGTKILNGDGNRLKDARLEYFANFRSAAISATAPTPVAALSTQDWAKVLTTVTSQALPRD